MSNFVDAGEMKELLATAEDEDLIGDHPFVEDDDDINNTVNSTKWVIGVIFIILVAIIWTFASVIKQEQHALLSIKTVQEPQSPALQPTLVPFKFSSSLRNSLNLSPRYESIFLILSFKINFLLKSWIFILSFLRF